MFKEFKEFAMRGSVLDMAIGIILGGAFTPIVKGLVDEVLMPIIGMFTGGIDFANRFLVLRAGEGGEFATLEAAREAGAVVIGYGVLINAIITFVLVAFSVFMMVKTINRWQAEEEEAADSGPSEEVTLLTEIRDNLQRSPGSST